jgi:Domain of unknown function (DUF5655)/Domain of unknown function (DUF4287)
MSHPDAGIRSQLRNIEQATGTTIETWLERIAACGLSKHTDVVAMLKRDHGLPHGAAHRLSLLARDRSRSKPPDAEAMIAALYGGRRANLVPIHYRLLAAMSTFGDDIELAPKRGYVSLRRRRQFAMVKPGATEVNVGLILADVPAHGRLESAATFNALFTHRVRLRAPEDVDDQLADWLRLAYALAA